ncbi:hypothetical protein LCGC14_2272360 [marine sediment metagenome]|uniref:Uncharacterized protein n=1 Tax=marine sediment metagenome TaxID=412755 RepID=A0A0F9DIY7_9ZZZZ
MSKKAMNKLRYKIIKEQVFGTETLFYQCDDERKVSAHAKRKYDINLDAKELKLLDGSCIEFHNKNDGVMWVVWVRNRDDWKVMVHEASHLVFRILDTCGVKYKSANDETWCYLHGYYISKFWHEMCK